jgi:zinc transport system substrate-binding protein
MRKKVLYVLLAAAVALTALTVTACGKGDNDEGKIKVVATVFPAYDWAKNIVGDTEGYSVKMVNDSGVDMHSFQPSADDIARISECDVFIYVGGESEKWVEDVLKEANNKEMITVNLMDMLGPNLLSENESEFDEHIWLSIANAELSCDAICDALSEQNADNANAFAENCDAYKKQLELLGLEYQKAVGSASKDMIVFADRFPFRYMMNEYGIDYYAAFEGCSAETEASVATILSLAGTVDRFDLPAVITIEGSDQKIAEEVVANTESKDVEILTMDAMQSVTAKDIENGATYISIMEEDLKVLEKALG